MAYIQTVIERNIDMWFFIQLCGFSSLSVGRKHEINAVFPSGDSLLSTCLQIADVPLLLTREVHHSFSSSSSQFYSNQQWQIDPPISPSKEYPYPNSALISPILPGTYLCLVRIGRFIHGDLRT